MRFLANWSVRNRAIVDVFVLAWLVGGLIAFWEIKREFFPSFSVDAIQVLTIYPGATSEDVERLVTDPLEDELVELSGLDRVESISAEGRSEITIFVDIDAAEVAEVEREVERVVERVRSELPEDAEDPQVAEIKLEEAVVSAGIIGEAPWEVRKQLVERLKDRVRAVPGVARIVVAGLEERVLQVEVDPTRLGGLGISASEIARAIQGADADLPAGALQTRQGEVLVRTVADLSSPEAIGRIVLRAATGSGEAGTGTIRIRDVATVRMALADERTRSRMEGRPATVLTIFKNSDADVLDLTARVKGILEEEARSFPPGLSLGYGIDFSEWLQERLNVTYMTAISGFILVFILLAIFLDPISAAWCAYGIPVAILGGVFMMYVTGSSLNMLTLFGFILVIGMLVDDAIVIVENVARYRDLGLPDREAVVRGASEIAAPVVAAVLTTLAALMPLALMSGVTGRFMAEIPKPAMFALAASLIEALITLPAHLYTTLHWRGMKGVERLFRFWEPVRRGGDRVVRRLKLFHLYWLSRCLRHRYLFFVGVAALFVGSLVVGFGVLRFELVSTTDAPLFQVEIRAPAGTSLDEVERIAAEVEEKIARLSKEEVERVSTTIGLRRHDQGFEYSKEVAQITVDLHEPDVRKRAADLIMSDLRPMLAEVRGAEVVLSEMQGGPPVGRPVSIRLLGDDLPSMYGFAERVRDHIAGLPGAVDVEISQKKGAREIVVRADEDMAGRVSQTARSLAAEVRAGVDGLEAASVRIGSDDVKILVRHPEGLRASTEGLERMLVPTPAGATSLAGIAGFERQRGWAQIRHYDGRRVITVSSDLARDGMASNEANANVRDAFFEEARDRGITLELGGEAEDTQKSLKSLLFAMLAGFALIGVILVVEFRNFLQPLAVLGAIPLAFIGVVLTLVAHTLLYETTGIGMDTPMGLLGLIGMTALFGVIVNDSIVLVSFINEARRSGANRWQSILRAGWTRLRPVMLTSVTTSAGILPMAYTMKGSSAFLAPMAISFGWGLIFGTLLTLFVVPTFVAVLDDLLHVLGMSSIGEGEEE